MRWGPLQRRRRPPSYPAGLPTSFALGPPDSLSLGPAPGSPLLATHSPLLCDRSLILTPPVPPGAMDRPACRPDPPSSAFDRVTAWLRPSLSLGRLRKERVDPRAPTSTLAPLLLEEDQRALLKLGASRESDVAYLYAMNPSINGGGLDGMRGSEDGTEDGVGVAYTTNDQVSSSAASFNQQYHQQQLAYQIAVQEQHEKQRQAAQHASPVKVIKTLDVHSPSASSSRNRSVTSLAPPDSLLPAQNRVFGLSKDLAGPSADSAHLDVSTRGLVSANNVKNASHDSLSSSGDSPTSPNTLHPIQMATSRNGGSNGASMDPNSGQRGGDGPQFSVEVIAPAFDKRGYPVFSGRGARIRGILRTKAVQGCEIIVKLTAGISQGSPAAVWDGVALMPPEQGNERKVFTVEERIVLNEGMASLRPGADPSSKSRDDYIYTIPFDMNLPLGVSTRFVNGEQTTTAVALPPSYEMSSENDAREKESTRANNLIRSSAASIKSKSSRMTNFSTNVGGIGATVREAVEKGLGEVYRIGCFYSMGFTLQTVPTTPAEPAKRRLGKKKKDKAESTVLDKIAVPFIFMGEPTSLPPPPHSIPLPMVVPVLLNAGLNLGDKWECERSQAKWSGNIFRTAKRTVDLEMHMPSPAVLQAPSVFPIILIIRPTDPNLLASIPSIEVNSPLMDTETIHGRFGHSPQSSVSKTGRMDRVQETEMLDSNDSPPDRDGMLSKFMRSSLTLGRKASNAQMNTSSSLSTLSPINDSNSSGNSIRGSLASTFSRRRPNTAPSGASSSDSPSGTSVIGSGGQYMGNLSGLVRVTLIQTTYCVSSGPSDVPKSRRKLISEAEMEEVDIASILKEKAGGTDRGDEATMAANHALVQHVQSKGIRVVRGTIRVGTDATPSFRCQGIEVKYALKVDLVPFSKKEKKRPASGGSGGTGTTLADNASHRSRPSMSQVPSSPSLPCSSPPLPPMPAEHRANQHSTSSTLTPLHIQHRQQPQYTPSVALGLGGGGTSTIVSESAMTSNRLEKGVGALWADVRMVRSAFAT